MIRTPILKSGLAPSREDAKEKTLLLRAFASLPEIAFQIPPLRFAGK